MEYEIKPQSKVSINFKELRDFSELFYFFTWRDIKVKYKQTILGFLWVVLQPIFMTLIFTVFFGETIKEKTQMAVPYSVFALSGMLIWGIFSNGMSNSANSMIVNANIIKKIYFPRLIIPISSVLVALFDFVIALVFFLIFIFSIGVSINYTNLLLIPIAVVITVLTSIGAGCWLGALNVKFRDVRYVIPFLVQGLLFLSPVMFPTNISKNEYVQILLKLNPLSGALELMRSIFIGYQVDYNTVYLSLISSIVLFIFGIYFFKKTEAYFADLA